MLKISLSNQRFFLNNKLKLFKIAFYTLTTFAFLLIFLIFLAIYFNPTSSLPIQGKKTLFFGFYWAEISDNHFDGVHISWISIVLSIFAILYILYACIFYWIYWNSEWSNYVKNSKLITFLVISGIAVVGGIILGFIDYPLLDFTHIDFSKGLDTINSKNLIEGDIYYNFIYNCHFVKNAVGEIYKDSLYLSEYGILSVIFVVTLLVTFVTSAVIMLIKRGF